MYSKSRFLVLLTLATALAVAVQAAPLAPNDASINDNLCLWLRNPGINLDEASATWIDSSDRGNDAVAVGDSLGATYVGPTLSFGSNPAVFNGEFSTAKFSGDADDLLRAPNINGGSNLSELTIIAVYKLYNQDQSGSGMTRPVGVGSFIGEGANLGNYFNLGNDVSIRKDNGSIQGATATHPDDEFFIRAARMNPSSVNQWFNTTGTLELVHEATGASYTTSTDNFYLGDLRADSTTGGGTSGYSTSDIEIAEVIVYNTDLSDGQIEGISEWLQGNVGSGGGNPLAAAPSPADGALFENTWASLSWRAGYYAVSHDLYFGSVFDDVNDGAEGTFVGNLATTSQVVGFPGFPAPDGLQPGTTYYWRIDEVNDANAASPWKGDVWSFSIPPKTAYAPRPADGAKFAAPDVELSWTGGFGAKLHTAYFGDNFDDVSNATGGLPSANTIYAPGTLELEKVYYWRVDEFDGAETHKGDVWSFTTTKAGGGLKAEYFNNTTLSGDPVLTRVDPGIDFDWGNADVPGENSPDANVNVNNFGARWTGELEVDLTDAYTFGINANNGFRLWLDGEPIINYWDNPTTSSRQSDPIQLVGGDSYSIRMDYFEGDDTAIAQLFWQSSTRDEQIIPSGALQPLSRAGDPSPHNGATGVTHVVTPTWRPSETAASHQVYFGTDQESVRSATTASPEYKGSKALGAEMFDPGKLDWHTTYYWRVDEVDSANSTVAGKVWSFTTADFLLVDGFESYDDIDPAPGESGINRIFDKWIDGFGTLTNGALVGNDLPPYAETSIVHGGFQSLVYRYDNAGKTSEATLTLVYPRDWTEEGVTKLSLWLRGASANAADRIYVALNGSAVVYHDDPAATQLTGWQEWIIDLSAFGGFGVNLTNVDSISIGIGTKNAPAPSSGAGTMYFDDIRLIR